MKSQWAWILVLPLASSVPLRKLEFCTMTEFHCHCLYNDNDILDDMNDFQTFFKKAKILKMQMESYDNSLNR